MKTKERFIWLVTGSVFFAIITASIICAGKLPAKDTILAARLPNPYERPLLYGEPSFYVDKKDMTPNTMPATIIRSVPAGKSTLPSGKEVLLYRTELDTNGDLDTVEFYSLTAFNKYFAEGRGLWIPDKPYIIYDSDDPNAVAPGPDPDDPQRISNLNFLAFRKTAAR